MSALGLPWAYPRTTTVKTIIRVDFLFFLFKLSLDSYYELTLTIGRLLLNCLEFFENTTPKQKGFFIKILLFLRVFCLIAARDHSIHWKFHLYVLTTKAH